MKLVEFLELVAEALDCEETLVVEDKVCGIEGWDSLGILSIVSMLDGLGMSVELDKFQKIDTIRDFVTLVGFVDE
jgi:acyl carrier protein